MKIAYLIPEFPGQTHAFFMRERDELTKRGVKASLYSTRPPENGAAAHEWAAAAAAETNYLTPLTPQHLLRGLGQLLKSGPVAWLQCLLIVMAAKDITLKQRCQLLAMIPVAAAFAAHAKRDGVLHLHIHSCANAAWIGVFASKLTGLKYSLTLHGPLVDYGPNQILKWRSAAFVIIITKELLAQVRNTLPADQLPPLLLAPMGVDVSSFQRTESYEPPSANSELRLVSCGRINVCKGHDDLIRVVHALRKRGIDAKLHICGASDGRKQAYLDLIQSLIDEFNLQDHVKLLGSVSEEVVRDELQSAHVFCLASHKEPLGVATMEAMSMEIPVIVTRSEGVTEMVESTVDGLLVQPHSPGEFVDRICELLDDPTEARRLGMAGRQTIVERFHSGVSAEAIIRGIEGFIPEELSKPGTQQATDSVQALQQVR